MRGNRIVDAGLQDAVSRRLGLPAKQETKPVHCTYSVDLDPDPEKK